MKIRTNFDIGSLAYYLDINGKWTVHGPERITGIRIDVDIRGSEWVFYSFGNAKYYRQFDLFNSEDYAIGVCKFRNEKDREQGVKASL